MASTMGVFIRTLLFLVATRYGSGCRHYDHVIECFQPLLQSLEYTHENNVMLVLSGDMKPLWEICKNYFKGQGCVDETLMRCRKIGHVTHANLEIYMDLVVKKGIVKLCENPSLLQRYTEHSSCFQKAQNQTAACLMKAESQFWNDKTPHNARSLDSLSRAHCRTIDSLMSCGYKTTANRCGRLAGLFYIDVVLEFLPKRIVDVCIGPFVRMPRGSHGYSHYVIKSGGSSALQQVYYGMFSLFVGLMTLAFTFCFMQ